MKVGDLFVGVGEVGKKKWGGGGRDTLYTWMKLSKNNKRYPPKSFLKQIQMCQLPSPLPSLPASLPLLSLSPSFLPPQPTPLSLGAKSRLHTRLLPVHLDLSVCLFPSRTRQSLKQPQQLAGEHIEHQLLAFGTRPQAAFPGHPDSILCSSSPVCSEPQHWVWSPSAATCG